MKAVIPKAGYTRRRGLRGVALTAAASVVIAPAMATAVVTPAHAAFSYDSDAASAAQGEIVFADALGLELVDSGLTRSSYPGAVGPDRNQLDVGLLGNTLIDLGPGLQLPLFKNADGRGLIDLGEVGAWSSYASSPSHTESKASAGGIGEGGAIAVSPNQGVGTNPAYVDLIDLFGQVGVDVLTDNLLDQARLQIGALASSVDCTSGDCTSQYVVAGADLRLRSPLVGTVDNVITSVLNEAIKPVDALVNQNGPLNAVLGQIKNTINAVQVSTPAAGARIKSNDLQVSIDGLDQVVAHITQTLLQDPWTNDSGSIVIEPNTGMVQVDLAKLAGGPNGLNGLDPNTEVFSEQFVQAVTTGIADTVAGVTTKINDMVMGSLNNLSLTIAGDINVQGHLPYVPFIGSPNWQNVVGGGLTIKGSIADFAGLSGTKPTIKFDFALPGPFQVIADVLAGVVNTATDAVSGVLTSALGPIVLNALDLVTSGLTPAVNKITETVFKPLNPVLEAIADKVVSLRINEQPTAAPLNRSGGDLGDGSFTVRALSLTLLPGNNSGHAASGVAKLALASSTAKSADEAAEDVLITSPGDADEVTAGDLPVKGTGEPGADITVELKDADGNVVATETTVVGEDGTWTVTFDDVEPGDYTVRAEQDFEGQLSEDEVTIKVVEDEDTETEASETEAAETEAAETEAAETEAAETEAAETEAAETEAAETEAAETEAAETEAAETEAAETEAAETEAAETEAAETEAAETEAAETEAA
ncbi:choice-of-anchor G family protein, partial [Leucobacter chinensis]|uniref:choice-of-anchor G family protein n=1 Tax=Leucobacter chinensis TaxID=2851010 RepID=UPI001C21C621